MPAQRVLKIEIPGRSSISSSNETTDGILLGNLNWQRCGPYIESGGVDKS